MILLLVVFPALSLVRGGHDEHILYSDIEYRAKAGVWLVISSVIFLLLMWLVGTRRSH